MSSRYPTERLTTSSKVMIVLLLIAFAITVACGITSNVVTGDPPNGVWFTTAVGEMIAMFIAYVSGIYHE